MAINSLIMYSTVTVGSELRSMSSTVGCRSKGLCNVSSCVCDFINCGRQFCSDAFTGSVYMEMLKMKSYIFQQFNIKTLRLSIDDRVTVD